MNVMLLALWAAIAAHARPPTLVPASRVSSEVGMVEGVVTGHPTGLALANVAVTLRARGEPWYLVRTTDADGMFRFSDLPAGVYILEAQQPGYLDATLGSVLVVPGVPVSEHLQMDVFPVAPRSGVLRKS